MKVYDMICEYMAEPLGIDIIKPRLGWKLKSNGRNETQFAYRIIVSDNIEDCNSNIGNMWDSGKIESNKTSQIVYNGKILKSCTRYWWEVQVWDKNRILYENSETSFWEMGLLNSSEWMGKWIGLNTKYMTDCSNIPASLGLPSPFMKKEFETTKVIKTARIYATSLGLYELYMNGLKVGDYVFTPGWTDYNVRVQYQTYDVTDLLPTGINTIGVILGDGWYTGNVAIVGKYQYGDYPLLFNMQLYITYEDGTKEKVITDNSWKGTTGPLISSDMQMGENYDARLENEDWYKANSYNNWYPVEEVNKPIDIIKAQIGPGVKVLKEMKPIDLKKINSNVYIFDLGQNMVGRILLKVSGNKGIKIKMRFGEMLNDDNTLYTDNLRTATQTDMYILRGEGVEYFETRFTFHGFRYVELTDYPGEPEIDSIIGKVITSALNETGSFECSSPMINKLQDNIMWGQRGNFIDIPTDCPQRDERMGWTGDGQIFARTACLNMDCAGFFTKWMNDINEAQDKSGAYSDVAPFVRKHDGEGLVGYGNAAWGDAGVIIPWTLYLSYGDTRILENNYDSIKKYIEYLRNNSDSFLRPDTGYGDWLSIDAETPKDVIGTAFFAYSTSLFIEIATVLKRLDDIKEYRNLLINIKKAFSKAYIGKDGRIKGDTQTCYLLALKFNLLGEEEKSLAEKYLVEDIEKRNCHLSTGFVGVSYLLPILSKINRDDIAYRLLLNDSYPSWGYSIKNGATTIWERWNSYTKYNGFGDVGMNSFNHYSFGSVGEWLYRFAAGIELDEDKPGYEHIIINPRVSNLLSFVKADYNSIHGKIISKWERKNDILNIYTSIPVNTHATVIITCFMGEVTEKGILIEDIKDITIIEKRDSYLKLYIGSGDYSFSALECHF